MKKLLYIMGSIEAVIGVVLLWTTITIKEAVPKIGYIAWQVHGGTHSSDYQIALDVPFAIATILVLVGLVQIIIAFASKKKD